MLQKASTKFFKSHPSFISIFIYLSIFLSLCLSLHLPIYTSSYFSIFLSLPHTIFLSMKEKNCVHLCGCSSPKTQHSRKHFHRSLCLSVFLSFYHSVSQSFCLSITASFYLYIFLSLRLSTYQPFYPQSFYYTMLPSLPLSISPTILSIHLLYG